MRSNRTTLMVLLAALAATTMAACASPGRAAPEAPSSPEGATAGAASAADANLAIARQFVEGFLGGKDPAVIDRVAHEDVQAYTGLKPDGPIRGRQQYKEVFQMFASAFPDVKLDIEDMFAAGDRVVVRFKAVGTHKGALFGVAPTNRVITFRETHVLRLANGRIVENRVGGNNLEFAMLMAPVLTPMVLPAKG